MPNYTLAADAGAFTLTGVAVGLRAARRLSAAAGAFVLTGTSTGLTRTFNASAQASELSLRLKRLSYLTRVTGKDGKPSFAFNRDYNEAMDAIEQSFANLVNLFLAAQTAYDAAAQAHSAANAATNAAAEAEAVIDEIEAGTLDMDAVKVGGVRFINSGGSLVQEP